MRKRIARVAVALLAATALAGSAASAAQAHEWTIEGSSLTKLGIVNQAVTNTPSSSLEISSTLFGTPFHVTCQMTFGSSTIVPGGTGTTRIQLSMCGGGGIGCEFRSKENPALSGELIEVGGVLYEKFAPVSGKNLFNFEVAGTSCVLKGEVPFQGNFAARIASPKSSLTSHSFELSTAINTAAGANFHWGSEAAGMNGGFTSVLAEPNKGKGWAAE